MKKQILFLIAFIGFNNLYAQFKQSPDNIEFIDYNEFPDKYVRQNKFNVENIYEYAFKREGEVKDSTISKSIHYLYDKQDRIIERQIFDRKNKMLLDNVYTYNVLNKISKEVNTYNMAPFLSKSIYEFTFDSLGNELYKYDYNPDTSRLKVVNKIYNDKYQLIKVLISLNRQKFHVVNALFYKEDGNLSRLEVLDTKGVVIYAYLYEYKNPYEKLINLKNADGIDLYASYIYNANNQCVEMKRVSMLNGLSEDIRYIYNKDGTLFEEKDINYGRIKNITRHYYKY